MRGEGREGGGVRGEGREGGGVRDEGREGGGVRGDREDRGWKECEGPREGSQGKCWIITDVAIVLSHFSRGTLMFSVFSMNKPHACGCILYE